ncbi:hypothetical protein MIR68_012333 [Amoeboaphelidium protococcarum]|nr:hypothetical protein MIR68_012333 [Amoeboaphelidium protococcarum]
MSQEIGKDQVGVRFEGNHWLEWNDDLIVNSDIQHVKLELEKLHEEVGWSGDSNVECADRKATQSEENSAGEDFQGVLESVLGEEEAVQLTTQDNVADGVKLGGAARQLITVAIEYKRLCKEQNQKNETARALVVKSDISHLQCHVQHSNPAWVFAKRSPSTSLKILNGFIDYDAVFRERILKIHITSQKFAYKCIKIIKYLFDQKSISSKYLTLKCLNKLPKQRYGDLVKSVRIYYALNTQKRLTCKRLKKLLTNFEVREEQQDREFGERVEDAVASKSVAVANAVSISVQGDVVLFANQKNEQINNQHQSIDDA